MTFLEDRIIVSKFASKSVFYQIYYYFPRLTNDAVRPIQLSDNQSVLYQAGEDVGNIWEYYRSPKGNFSRQSIAVYHRYGASCPSNGCGRCELTDCFFYEFIHKYCNHPKGD
jgi:hypothetical protein